MKKCYFKNAIPVYAMLQFFNIPEKGCILWKEIPSWHSTWAPLGTLNRLFPDSGASLAGAGAVGCGIGPCHSSWSMSIENATRISDEQRGSAIAGFGGGRRRLIASSGPAVCLLSAGVQSACVLLRAAASNAVLPGLVRPAILSVLVCPPVLPDAQRASVLPGTPVLPGTGADADNCGWRSGDSSVLHGAGR